MKYVGTFAIALVAAAVLVKASNKVPAIKSALA